MEFFAESASNGKRPYDWKAVLEGRLSPPIVPGGVAASVGA
jgi:hypothetical protein